MPWADIATAADSLNYASDLTHSLYRYPARMSPELARALIRGLTKPGGTVLDPFSGGGTTAIEALASGRRAICSDLNALACFVTMAKAWPTSRKALRIYQTWVHAVESRGAGATRAPRPLVTRDGLGYAPRTHADLLSIRNSALRIADPEARRLALLTVLRVGQICFDCRRTPPSPSILSAALHEVTELVSQRMGSYAAECGRHRWPGGLRRRLRVLRGDVREIVRRLHGPIREPVDLILTSPPYPGVHVLYHRWQVYGRKETRLPYDLLSLSDGRFESHYTMGSRRRADEYYFDSLRSTFEALRRLTGPSTLVAQVVGFADPARHLSRFRETMSAAGYDELVRPASSGSVVRSIPHRRWYTQVQPGQGNGEEVVLIHRPSAPGTTARAAASRTRRAEAVHPGDR